MAPEMNEPTLNVLTLALDALPWIACTYAELTRLTDIPWKWTIVHGASMPGGSTGWMRHQPSRLSSDGTTEFLAALKYHPRITVLERASWPSKDFMCNAAVETFDRPGVLLQVDGDELWTADQLRRIRLLFTEDPNLMLARFHCRYFVGSNIVTTDAGSPNEWLRAWRYEDTSTRFLSHEPPNFGGNRGKSLMREQAKAMNLVFDHHSWTLPKHVAMKEKLYGARYNGVSAGWKSLQANQAWPIHNLGDFLPRAFSAASADRIFKT